MPLLQFQPLSTEKVTYVLEQLMRTLCAWVERENGVLGTYNSGESESTGVKRHEVQLDL